jgi:transketolase
MHTLKPIDGDAILAACRETGGVVTYEEHTLEGGLGSAVAEVCVDAGVFPRGFRRLALREGFSAVVGSQEYLRTRYGLDEDAVRHATRALVAARTPR